MRGITPILYIGNSSDSHVAQSLLVEGGFQVEVESAPIFYEVAFGTPVFFALSNKFEGVEGVRVFIENARILEH
ncbi:MAG: hypothetical protein WBQ61_12145 [Candidatus Acidiferrum sp.]